MKINLYIFRFLFTFLFILALSFVFSPAKSSSMQNSINMSSNQMANVNQNKVQINLVSPPKKKSKEATTEKKITKESKLVEQKQSKKKPKQTAKKNTKIEAKEIKSLEPALFKEKPQMPNYPKLAINRKYQGKATLELLLDENGKVLKSVVINSTGFKILDKEALSATLLWQFNLKKVQAKKIQVPISFKLS